MTALSPEQGGLALELPDELKQPRVRCGAMKTRNRAWCIEYMKGIMHGKQHVRL